MRADQAKTHQPLWAQVADALRQEIGTVYATGDTLPPEGDLEQRFGVSRITIRRAVAELAAEGLVTRRQGRGTFVRGTQITQDLGLLTSWTSAIRQMGYEPQTMDTRIEVIDPDPDIRSHLAISEREQVVKVDRVRFASGEPICLMTNYVSLGLLPDLPHSGLVNDSLFDTMLAAGLRPARAEDTVEAFAASPDQADLLHIDVGAPILQVTRVSWDLAGQPLDVAVVANRADRFRYTVRPSTDGGNR
jgi:GntR family transcriptional regulator